LERKDAETRSVWLRRQLRKNMAYEQLIVSDFPQPYTLSSIAYLPPPLTDVSKKTL
jgi:hypothetical protein